MKTHEQAHEILDEWMNGEYVGNLIFFKAPRANMVDAFLEQTIKRREMDSTERGTFEDLFNEFKFDRAELFRDRNGKPDRIKITRSI